MDLLNIQPISCRETLTERELKGRWRNNKVIKRVLFFNPSNVFERITEKADPFKRTQVSYKNFTMSDLFPQFDEKSCACGCGVELSGRRKRWATKECADFGDYIYSILSGRYSDIKRCLKTYYGTDDGKFVCLNCGVVEDDIQIDHTIPVFKGGGCCWLSNLKPMCKGCHKDKTKIDLYS